MSVLVPERAYRANTPVSASAVDEFGAQLGDQQTVLIGICEMVRSSSSSVSARAATWMPLFTMATKRASSPAERVPSGWHHRPGTAPVPRPGSLEIMPGRPPRVTTRRSSRSQHSIAPTLVPFRCSSGVRDREDFGALDA